MKFISLTLLIFLFPLNVFALKPFEKVEILYSQAKYTELLTELDSIEDKKNQGIVSYWRALALSKTQQYSEAVQSFQKAISFNYIPDDLYYEFGQTLYVSDKLVEARIAFKNSLAKKYKMGVSLYYMGYISVQLKDYKKAVSYFKMVEDVSSKEEKEELLQASYTQIGDIYLSQVEKEGNRLNSIEKYVLPYYEEAYEMNKSSRLAQEISEKIEKLQRKYDLVLFKMRNGKPTQRPPHFLKLSASVMQDSNVNSSIKEYEESSLASQYSFFSRYSFYPGNVYSISTELSGSFQKYHSEKNEVKQNDNYDVGAALRMNYEHSYRGRAATTYIDYDYNYLANANDDGKNMKKDSTTHSFSIGEEIPFFKDNPTTLRYRFSNKIAVQDIESSTTHSFSYEQLYALGKINVFSYLALDISNFQNNLEENNNATTLRFDFIFPTIFNSLNPNIFLSMTKTKYVKDSSRGEATLFNPGLSLVRPFNKSFYGTLTYSMMNQTAKLDSDEFKKNVISFNLDYIY